MNIASFDLDRKVLVVAEVGNNHEGRLDVAERLIGLAAEAGADAVKFQTIVPERLVRPQQEARLAQLSRFRLDYTAFEVLARAAEREGILFLSTPFDKESAVFLDSLVPAFKIASGDNDFFPLLETVAATGKPVILSTGLGSLETACRAKACLEEVWQAANHQGELALLHCVASYPTPAEEANLGGITTLRQIPGVTVGYSDHTLGIEAAVLSVALGARLIEKHFTLDKNYSDFHDHRLSADPVELACLVARVRQAETLLGDGCKRQMPCEAGCAVGARRSIVAGRALAAGTVLAEDMLDWLRPGDGLSPSLTGALLGRRLARDLERGERITFDDCRED